MYPVGDANGMSEHESLGNKAIPSFLLACPLRQALCTRSDATYNNPKCENIKDLLFVAVQKFSTLPQGNRPSTLRSTNKMRPTQRVLGHYQWITAVGCIDK